MRPLILVVLVMLCFSSCSKTETGKINGKEYSITPVDSTNNHIIETADFIGVIFGSDLEKLPEEDHLFNPTAEEIFKAEKVFNRCLNVDKVGADNMPIDPRRVQKLTNYYRQYGGFVNDKGQKEIGIRFFAKTLANRLGRNWKKERLEIIDGGSSFFSIVINIDTEECCFFIVNGLA